MCDLKDFSPPDDMNLFSRSIFLPQTLYTEGDISTVRQVLLLVVSSGISITSSSLDSSIRVPSKSQSLMFDFYQWSYCFLRILFTEGIDNYIQNITNKFSRPKNSVAQLCYSLCNNKNILYFSYAFEVCYFSQRKSTVVSLRLNLLR